MPVMSIFRGLKISPAQYDEVRERVGWEAAPPRGAISHAIAFTEDGATEFNLWESRGDWRAYHDYRLAPVLAEMGLEIGEPELLDVHNTAIGPPAADYAVPTRAEPATLPEGPVMVVYHRSTISSDLYEEFRRSLPLDTVPKGALIHVNGRLDARVVTVDVWEDSAALSAFIHDALIPAVAARGVEFVWPEIIKVDTLVTTPDAKGYERPFAQAAWPAASALTPAE